MNIPWLITVPYDCFYKPGFGIVINNIKEDNIWKINNENNTVTFKK